MILCNIYESTTWIATHTNWLTSGLSHQQCLCQPLGDDASYGEFHRTTLMQFDDGRWELIEMCEKMEDMIFSDLTFEQPGMRGVITILSDDATTPEQMGFTLEGELSIQPRAEREEQQEEEYPQEIPMAPEDEEVYQEMVEEEQAAEQKEVDKVVVEPFMVDKIVVNGIELTSESSLTSLRAACTSQEISTSGSRLKCYIQEIGEPLEDFGVTSSI